MISKASTPVRNTSRHMSNGSLGQRPRLIFSVAVAVAGSFLLGRIAAEVAAGQLLTGFGLALAPEQAAGRMLLGLAALLVLLRLDHICGICRAFEAGLAWLQQGGVEENG